MNKYYNRKTLYFFMMVAILGILSFGCKQSDPDMDGERFTASAAGYGGNVTVDVTVAEDGKINAIKIDVPEETPNIGGAVVPNIAEQIITTQSLKVDAVTGATITSNAILNATEAALKDAGLDTEALKKE